jgi:TonB family protein
MPDRDSGASPNARFLAGDNPAPGTSRGRIGNALSVSLLTHVAGFLLVALVMSRLPVSRPPSTITYEPPSRITWIVQAGRDGGGREPARQAEAPGRRALTVPVSKPAPDVSRNPPQPEQQLQIPAVATFAGVQELPGIIPAPTPVSITDAQGPGSGGPGGQGIGSDGGPDTGPGLGPGRNGTGGDANGIGNGVVAPRLIREIKPGYTPEAMRARIQGMVTLQAVVLPDGSVGTARIIRSLDSTFGLDQEAVRTVKLWRFAPGTRAGEPCRCSWKSS